jgi:hypothetical protein
VKRIRNPRSASVPEHRNPTHAAIRKVFAFAVDGDDGVARVDEDLGLPWSVGSE